jgi:hypothetical protein
MIIYCPLTDWALLGLVSSCLISWYRSQYYGPCLHHRWLSDKMAWVFVSDKYFSPGQGQTFWLYFVASLKDFIHRWYHFYKPLVLRHFWIKAWGVTNFIRNGDMNLVTLFYVWLCVCQTSIIAASLFWSDPTGVEEVKNGGQCYITFYVCNLRIFIIS